MNKIADYDVIPVKTGRFALDGGAMFGVVPKNLWAEAIPADENNCIPLALRSLLLRSKNRTILIDTGIGQKFDEKLSRIYKIESERYSLTRSLMALQIKNEEITDVILTHLHFDHAGGSTYFESGALKITFPNAIHHIQREQWEWAMQPSDKDQASFIKNDFLLLEKNLVLNKLSGPGELYPGIELLVMHGHTPGMQLVKISDNAQTLLFCSDLIPTSAHISLPWVMAYDNNPLITINEKKTVLSRAVEEGWILFFEHDPFLAGATARKSEKGYTKDRDISFLRI